jgi:hypothetical protein
MRSKPRDDAGALRPMCFPHIDCRSLTELEP